MAATTSPPGISRAALRRSHDLQEERLDALARLIGGPLPLPDLAIDAVRAALNDLARSMVIQFIGPRRLPPGRPLAARLNPQPSEMVIPVPTVGSVPVGVAVTWSVLDAQNQSVTPGEAFVAPNGLALPDVSLIFAPAIAALPAPASAARQFSIGVRVTLSLQLPSLLFGGTHGGFVEVLSDEITLPPPGVELPTVSVLPLEIPTLLLLFRHPNLAPRADGEGGFVLVVARDGLPSEHHALSQVKRTLSDLGGVLPTLSVFPQFASTLPLAAQLTTIGTLSYPNPALSLAQEIADLDRVTLADARLQSQALAAAQEVSSLMLLGVEGARVECFNHRNFHSGEGKLTLTTGPELHVIVRNLHSKQPRSEPVGRVTVDVVPDRVGNRSFGDELVSLRFS